MSLFDGKTDDQTVRDIYSIDEEILSDLSETSGYWENSHKFYTEVKDKPYISMSQKQKGWLSDIEDKHKKERKKF